MPAVIPLDSAGIHVKAMSGGKLRASGAGTPLLAVEALAVDYTLPAQRLLAPARRLRAVDGVSLRIERGEALGLVGETGCGKSSFCRAVYGLAPISGGAVRFEGVDLSAARAARRREIRKGMQMIFQDPGGSLNPRMRVGDLIAEPLEIHREGDRRWRRDKVSGILRAVGLEAGDSERYPHEFSGGQRQRIAIARAVVIEPSLILADEPVSALDVSLQAQILNLIAALRRRLGLALLFVSHDLNVVGHLCDRIAVMYLGRVVESGPAAQVLASPVHPYTRELVASSPVPDPARPLSALSLAGDPPNPAEPPAGCRYHPRCPHASGSCFSERPPLATISAGRHVACHHLDRVSTPVDLPFPPLRPSRSGDATGSPDSAISR